MTGRKKLIRAYQEELEKLKERFLEYKQQYLREELTKEHLEKEKDIILEKQKFILEILLSSGFKDKKFYILEQTDLEMFFDIEMECLVNRT